MDVDRVSEVFTERVDLLLSMGDFTRGLYKTRRKFHKNPLSRGTSGVLSGEGFGRIMETGEGGPLRYYSVR